MTTTEPIFELVGVGSDAGALISPSIFATRDHFLKELLALKPASRNFVEVATSVVRDAKKLLKQVEGAREVVKAPILEISRKIDSIAKDFRTELQSEIDKIERQVGEAVRKEREEKLKEETRIKAEQEAILAAELAQKAALQAKLDRARSDSKKEEIALQMEQVDANTVADLQALAPRLEESRTPVLSGGSQVRAKWTANLTDWRQAFEHCPQIFDVALSASKFAAWAKLNEVGGMLPQVPGLTASREIKASIR